MTTKPLPSVGTLGQEDSTADDRTSKMERDGGGDDALDGFTMEHFCTRCRTFKPESQFYASCLRCRVYKCAACIRDARYALLAKRRAESPDERKERTQRSRRLRMICRRLKSPSCRQTQGKESDGRVALAAKEELQSSKFKRLPHLVQVVRSK